MVPAEIGMQLVQRPTTPWELMELLTNYGADWGDTMQKLLEPVLMWTMVECLQGQSSDESRMALPFSPITRPSVALVKKMKAKLEESLGRSALPQP